MSPTSLLRGAAIAVALLAALPAGSADDPLFESQGSWGQGYADQWGLRRVLGGDPDAPRAWRVEDGSSRPVTVAVIDTGLDYLHPDLDPDRIWRNPGERPNGLDDDDNGYVDDLIGWNFVGNDNNPFDDAGHGTHVAGIIAAATGNGRGMAGVSRGAVIMPLKVLNVLGRGRSSGIADAIYYAVAHGARVINLSLGGEAVSALERRAIDAAHAAGVLVVVASGNEGVSTENYGPAALENVLSVGATGPDDQRLGFSNWGPGLDLVAPGLDIVSLRARFTDFATVAGMQGYRAGDGIVGADARYYRASGTSFAAPFVAGVAALLVARDPGLDAAALMRILRQSARDVGVPGIDQYTGYGLVDATAALELEPGFFVEVRIDGVEVVQKKGRPYVRVLGTADADALDEAWIEIGEGTEPRRFERVGRPVGDPVRGGVLAEIDARDFSGARQWTLRVIGRHRSGREREARFLLNLG